MDSASILDRLHREERLDEDWLHLFALGGMIRVLREEPEYEKNGHTGVILLKTRHLRVVLEASQGGSRIGEHTVHGPTVIYVLEGSVHLSSGDETRIAHRGEMVVIPHDRPRELHTKEDSAFLWVLSLDQDATSGAATDEG